MFNLNSLPSHTMTDSVLVNSVLSEPSISESENPVKKSQSSGNFFSDLLLFFKVAFSPIDDV
jgi:hypothetical protein